MQQNRLLANVSGDFGHYCTYFWGAGRRDPAGSAISQHLQVKLAAGSLTSKPSCLHICKHEIVQLAVKDTGTSTGARPCPRG